MGFSEMLAPPNVHLNSSLVKCMFSKRIAKPLTLTAWFVSPHTDWPKEDTEQAAGSTAASNNSNDHLWEESWDDDDENEDFSKQLKSVAPLSFTRS
jgi:hypothetical protein